jgi:hypothetical protein
MKQNRQRGKLSELKRLLRNVLPGPIENAQVKRLLIKCWELLDGSDQEGTSPEKLCGRIENLRWEPPHILFQIERHGGTVMGSSRAEIHDWAVNVDTGEARCATGRYRQIVSRDRALNVGPLVNRVVDEMRSGKSCPDLKWLAPDTVRINIGHVIPATFQKTTEGRRRRFKQKLEPRLAQLGWHKLAGTAPNTYQRIAAGTKAPVGGHGASSGFREDRVNISSSVGPTPAVQHTATAIHEAGHAVVAVYLNVGITELSIEGDEEANGYWLHPAPLMFECGTTRERQKLITDMILATYAGFQAELQFDPHALDFHANGDEERAFDLLREGGSGPRGSSYVGDEVYDRYLEGKKKQARRLVKRLWPVIRELAGLLLERTTILGPEAERFVRERLGSYHADKT